jgi:hypothetical protein
VGVAAVAAVVAPSPDEVIAIPMNAGDLAGWSMAKSVVAAVGQDGSFSLDLARSSDWLLVLADSRQSGEGRFIGSVNVRVASGAGLLQLPITGAAAGDLPLGVLSSSGDGDVTSDDAVDAAAFTMSATQLDAIARADDLFRNALNLVNNYGTFGNPAGAWYQLRPDFSWSGGSAITAAFSDPDALAFDGMGFQLDTNATAVTIDELCDGVSTVTFEPPQPVTIGGTSYDQGNPVTSGGATCTTIVRDGVPGREFWSGSLYGASGYETAVTYSMPAVSANPPGFWTWREDGAVKAMFDVASVNPPVTEAGKPTGFVPSFRVNTGSGGRILSVDVKWFYFDAGAGAYVALLPADLAVLKHFVGAVEVKFDRTYGEVRRTEEIYVDPSTVSNVVPTKEWYFGTHAADPSLETGLMGFYSTGGFGYFFHFRPALTP